MQKMKVKQKTQHVSPISCQNVPNHLFFINVFCGSGYKVLLGLAYSAANSLQDATD